MLDPNRLLVASTKIEVRQREVRVVAGEPWIFWVDVEDQIVIEGPSGQRHRLPLRSKEFWLYYRDSDHLSLVVEGCDESLTLVADVNYPKQWESMGPGRLWGGGSNFFLVERHGQLMAFPVATPIATHRMGGWSSGRMVWGWTSAGTAVWWAVGCLQTQYWILGYHRTQGIFVQHEPLGPAWWPILLASPQLLYLAWWANGRIICQTRRALGWPYSAVCESFALGPADCHPPALTRSHTRLMVQWVSGGRLLSTDWDSRQSAVRTGTITSLDAYASYTGDRWRQHMLTTRFSPPIVSTPAPSATHVRAERYTDASESGVAIPPPSAPATTEPVITSMVPKGRLRCLRSRDLGRRWRKCFHHD